ncbi:hypothetical protein JCM18897A_26330 [Streptomyces sp. JCM 18897]
MSGSRVSSQGFGSGGAAGSALALVQLLHAQADEGENADADQDQQGGEECLKHGVLLGDTWMSGYEAASSLDGLAPALSARAGRAPVPGPAAPLS